MINKQKLKLNNLYLFFLLKKFKFLKNNKNIKPKKIEIVQNFYFFRFYVKFLKIILLKYIFLKNIKNNINIKKLNNVYICSNKIKRINKLTPICIFYKLSNQYYIKNNLNSKIRYNCFKFFKIKKLSKIIIFIKFFNILLYNNNYKYEIKKFNKNSMLIFLTNLIDYNNINLFSSKYLINLLSVSYFDKNFFKNNNLNFYYYNNYYPVFLNKYIYLNFFKKFSHNYNINYILYTNKIVITFLEIFFKKKVFLKVANNKQNKINNEYFNYILNEYRNFQPLYFKKYLILDFVEIVWYSFLLKDLKMLSDWISKFMESLNFKNHKKFLTFFNNFLTKHSSLFIDVLKIKGFFFDIRGKVGVTGSSKKRHFCFKFGSLNKSSKNYKMNFNQNLVRTYSGVMGLTYIISY